jgi:hypothetical protein
MGSAGQAYTRDPRWPTPDTRSLTLLITTGYGARFTRAFPSSRSEEISTILARLFVTAFYQPPGVRRSLAVSVLSYCLPA